MLTFLCFTNFLCPAILLEVGIDFHGAKASFVCNNRMCGTERPREQVSGVFYFIAVVGTNVDLYRQWRIKNFKQIRIEIQI